MKDPKEMTDDELEREIERTKSVTERVLEKDVYNWILIREEGRRLQEEFTYV